MNAKGVTPVLNVSDMAASFAWFAKWGWGKLWDWGTLPTFGAVGSSEVDQGKSRSLTPLAKSASGFGMTIFRLGVAKGRIHETRLPATVRGRYIACERLMQVAANAMWRTKSLRSKRRTLPTSWQA